VLQIPVHAGYHLSLKQQQRNSDNNRRDATDKDDSPVGKSPAEKITLDHVMTLITQLFIEFFFFIL
jgi:hypothetical protein